MRPDAGRATLSSLSRNVSKHFGGLQVINHLDFAVNEEETVGLIGPNGAGKTTVFNLITSIYNIDRGSIRFKDKEISGLAPHKICHLGICEDLSARPGLPQDVGRSRTS